MFRVGKRPILMSLASLLFLKWFGSDCLGLVLDLKRGEPCYFCGTQPSRPKAARLRSVIQEKPMPLAPASAVM